METRKSTNVGTDPGSAVAPRPSPEIRDRILDAIRRRIARARRESGLAPAFLERSKPRNPASIRRGPPLGTAVSDPASSGAIAAPHT